MASLADSFLEDLDELNESDSEDIDDIDDESDNESMDEANDGVITELVKIVESKVANTIGALRQGSKYCNTLRVVVQALGDAPAEITNGSLEDDPEYKLILTCNKLVQEIDDDIIATHRYVADIYAIKFPELESLIVNKYDYIKTVLRIGNEHDITLVNLDDILPSSSVMIVSVTGSTTSGQSLNEKNLLDCCNGCEEIIKLEADKSTLLSFVESRMNRISPNLCALIGSRVAAHIVGLAGGVLALSRIPACNIQVMGQERKNLSGFSNLAAMPHTGVIYYCDLVQSCPPILRRKALKVIAGKVALVARVDAYNNHPNGGEGQKFRLEMEEKIEKWQEPPKARTKKALPVPEEKRKSRRGGKRMRRMKERYAMTEMRAQQNKISFSTDVGEYGDSAMGLDVGMVGHKDSGRVRAVKAKDAKYLKKQKIKGASSSLSTNIAGSTGTSGLASSLVFTPVQGMELINPNAAAERVKAANNKWFNAQSGFLSALPKAR